MEYYVIYWLVLLPMTSTNLVAYWRLSVCLRVDKWFFCFLFTWLAILSRQIPAFLWVFPGVAAVLPGML